MALDKDILGTALFEARKVFNDKTWQQLLADYGNADGIGLAMAKADAQAIINHIKNYGAVPAMGLLAPDGPVTGAAQIE